MDCLCVGVVCGVEDGIVVQVVFMCWCWVDCDGFVGYVYMVCVVVSVGIYCYGGDVQVLVGGDDVVGDFVLVGDQDFGEYGGFVVWVSGGGVLWYCLCIICGIC